MAILIVKNTEKQQPLVDALNAIFKSSSTLLSDFHNTSDRTNPLLRVLFFPEDPACQAQLHQLKELYSTLDELDQKHIRGMFTKAWKDMYKVTEPFATATWVIENGLPIVGIDMLTEWQDYLPTGLLKDIYYTSAQSSAQGMYQKIQPYIHDYINKNRHSTWQNILSHGRSHQRFESLPNNGSLHECFQKQDHQAIATIGFNQGWTKEFALRLERHLKRPYIVESNSVENPRRAFAAQMLQLMHLRHELYTPVLDNDFSVWSVFLTDNDIKRFDATRKQITMLHEMGYDRNTIASSLQWSGSSLRCDNEIVSKTLPDDFNFSFDA